MGEKPTEADERSQAAKEEQQSREAGSGQASGLRESPTRASAGREAGSGMATGRIADVDADGSPDIAIDEPGVQATQRQKNWLPSNFREGAGGSGSGNIAIGDPGVNGIALNEEGVSEAGGIPVASGDETGDSAGRAVAGGQTDPTPAEATNLNSSKSNIERSAPGKATESQQTFTADTTPPEALSINLNSSRSNVAD